MGASIVLLGELYDGYRYRLLVIGHLHEAESEAQEWRGLHNAIRQARKDYQTKGTIPDYLELADLIEEVA